MSVFKHAFILEAKYIILVCVCASLPHIHLLFFLCVTATHCAIWWVDSPKIMGAC